MSWPYKPNWPLEFLCKEIEQTLETEYSKTIEEILADLEADLATTYFVKKGDPVQQEDHNVPALMLAKIEAAIAKLYEEIKKKTG